MFRRKEIHQLTSNYATGFKYAIIGLGVLAITLVLPKQAHFKLEYKKGSIWMEQELIAPYRFAIKKTAAEIAKDRQEVLQSILPIYQNNAAIGAESIQAFNTNFEVKWHHALIDESQKNAYKILGNTLLKNIYARGLIIPIKKNQPYTFNLLNKHVAKQMRSIEVYTIETGLKYAEQAIDEHSFIKNKNWLLNLIEAHLQANYSYDEGLTNKLKTDALASVFTTHGMVEKGEVIVDRGAIIDQDVYQKLESFQNTSKKNNQTGNNLYLVLFGNLLLVSLAIGLLVIFLHLFRPHIYHNNRQILLIMLLITCMFTILSWSIQIKIPSVYYIPYCIIPIVIRILFDARLALNIHLLVILIAGFFVPNSFEFTFIQITTGIIAIYGIKNLIRRKQFFISAILILGNYLVVCLSISFIRHSSIAHIDWGNFIPFLFSVLLSLLAYPLIYAFEALFGITSDVSLMELTNTNTTLLRNLAYKAPGTFQHSLQVANLAESVIFKIGGNALLVRAGALYHDIGKMDQPQYFIENQHTGTNLHDTLSYEKSAQMIIQHVTKGIEMARHQRLPEIVIDFIRTHHGNTRLDHFYQSFLKSAPKQSVDENVFRYPGPIPFSKETAVLMLADSVEAASRSLKKPDTQAINNLVERIIAHKLAENQLINSEITLKDIETIKSIFKTILTGIYHVRVAYNV